MLSVGLKNAQGVLMHDSQSAQKTDSPFPDPEYRIDNRPRQPGDQFADAGDRRAV